MKILLLLFACACHFAHAQNLTGTWEGESGGDFLQINIVHSSKGICGYTYDYVRGDEKSYCKAFFEGHYNPNSKIFHLRGTYMFETGGGHVLMELVFKYQRDKSGRENLIELPETPGFLGQVFELDPNLGSLGKTSTKPTTMLRAMLNCKEDEPKKDTVKKIIISAPKPLATAPKPVSKAPETLIEKKVLPKRSTEAIKQPILETAAPQKINVGQIVGSRKTNIITTVKVKAGQLTIKIYDNGTVDGDTISVFHNGQLLVAHQQLSEKPIVLTIEVNKDKPKHEIVLFAENLGSIPPNTALLIIQAGEKRYELRSAADLTQNSSIVFEYAPN
jgi:hypothetical protein